MEFLFFAVCSLCVLTASAETYKAGIILSGDNVGVDQYLPIIYEAGELNVDILVLPTSNNSEFEDYDETVKTLSEAAKEASSYLVAHLIEKTRCHSRSVAIRSNIVFNREGDIVITYRKSQNSGANCTFSSSETTFITDFGVKFGVFMEEDLVLRSVDNNLYNFVVTGSWDSEIPFLSASQFSPAWSYVNRANLVTSAGIFSGNINQKTHRSKLVTAHLHKNGGEISRPPVLNATYLRTYPNDDLSKYNLKMLNMEASSDGLKETVCHGSICCEFYVKTSFVGKSDISYGLAAFDGTRHYDSLHIIGAQTCAIFACAGLYKRSCMLSSHNNGTNVVFDRITISGNFSDRSPQYPLIVSTSTISDKQFDYRKEGQRVTTTLTDTDLLSFGIFGRLFSNDFESNDTVIEDEPFTLYNYIFNDDVLDYFDYFWNRIKILIFILSIYILETI